MMLLSMLGMMQLSFSGREPDYQRELKLHIRSSQKKQKVVMRNLRRLYKKYSNLNANKNCTRQSSRPKVGASNRSRDYNMRRAPPKQERKRFLLPTEVICRMCGKKAYYARRHAVQHQPTELFQSLTSPPLLNHLSATLQTSQLTTP